MNLYQASRCYFSKSQSALKLSLGLSLALLVLTILALRPSGSTEDAILIVTIAGVQLVQMWQKYRSLYWLGKADAPRRMHQLQNGLGLEPSEEKCASIEDEIGACNEPIDPNYWLSRKETGDTRMVEMILESSFYTRSLAKHCRNLFFGFGLSGSALALLVLVVTYRLRTGETSEFLSHVVLAALTFFLTGDFWNISFLYNDLYHAADDSHKRAYEQLKAGNITFPAALETAMDYNTAVVQAPPILSFKYQRQKDSMNGAFIRAYGKLLGLDAAKGEEGQKNLA